MEPVWAVWDDPAVDWGAFDLVVVRSAWDYAERWREFLDWVESVPRIENPVPALRFGIDKERYLTLLHDRGVPVVQTTYFHGDDEFNPWPVPFVVKPAISAGGRRSARFEAGDEAAGTLVAGIVEAGGTAMVQPLIEDAAEIALVFVDGLYSHALSRRAALPLGGAEDVLYLDEELARHDGDDAGREIAEAALALVPAQTLYGRVDLLDGKMLELEVVEPSLYLSFEPSAADRLAVAIAARLGRT